MIPWRRIVINGEWRGGASRGVARTSGEGPPPVPLPEQVFGDDQATAAAGREEQEQPSHLRGVVVIADCEPYENGGPGIPPLPNTLCSARLLEDPA